MDFSEAINTIRICADALEESGDPRCEYVRAAIQLGGMVEKKFGVDLHSAGGALTLPASAVLDGEKTHGSGWTIRGEVVEDYYCWVNDFTAIHPIFGEVEGNFESVVRASSEAAFQHFWQHHEPEAWDYLEI